jgi:hypothetical protein
MGTFIHALDAETGRALWTNSGSGSAYTVQEHGSPAFAGAAPQGYLAAAGDSLLVSGGRLAFTGSVCREPTEEPALDPYGAPLLSLEETVARVDAMGFRVTSAEDISAFDLERGWLPVRQKLEDNEARYRELMGEEWVERAYRDLDADTAAWHERRLGSGRVVAVKA